MRRSFTFLIASICFAFLAMPANAGKSRQSNASELSPEGDAVRNTVAKIGELVTVNLNGQILNYWETGKLAQQPLIIFSHGLGGCGTHISFLATEFAKHGWLVVAPDHSDAACKAHRTTLKPMSDPATWDETTFVERRDEIRKVYRSLRNDAAWRNRIDWSRVSLAGHSLGGYAALAMAGGLPAWKMDGISAVLVLSPYCGALNSKGTLSEISIPVMFFGGNHDDITGQMVTNPGGCFERTGGEVSFVELDRAHHMSFTNVDGIGHTQMISYATQFFTAVYDGRPLHLTSSPGVSGLKQK